MTRAPSAHVPAAIADRRVVTLKWHGSATRVGVPRAALGIMASDPLDHRPILDLKAVNYPTGTSPMPDLRCPELMALGALAELAVERTDEDITIEGNAGDADQVKYVRDQLDRGNEWAWCSVRVCATIGKLVGYSSWLGGCSYASEHDFTRAGCYYDDLRSEALGSLLHVIKTAVPRSLIDKL